MDEDFSESIDSSYDADISDVDISDDYSADIPDDIPDDILSGDHRIYRSI